MPSWLGWLIGIVVTAGLCAGGAALAHHELGWGWGGSIAASPLVVIAVALLLVILAKFGDLL